MKIRFATKRNASGNRHYLIIDTREQTFSREPSHWYCREDFIEISMKDRRKLIEDVENRGFTELDNDF